VETASLSPAFPFSSSGAPPPSVSDKVLFTRYAQGDVQARAAIVERYMPLARRLASRYRNSGEAREDLEQVAYVGLLKTIDRFEPQAGSFIGYAIPSIRGELKRHFRDKGWGMRVPRPIQERWLRVSEATDRLTADLGRSPSPREVAAKTQLTVEEVLEALDAAQAYSPRALDAPIASDDDGARTLGESIGHVDEGFHHVELGASISPAFADLPERQQQIVQMRFIEDLTQAQIAERFGISQMHVSRLLRRSLDHLGSAVGEAA
jgi:RNA polymerase sigma-B factor